MPICNRNYPWFCSSPQITTFWVSTRFGIRLRQAVADKRKEITFPWNEFLPGTHQTLDNATADTLDFIERVLKRHEVLQAIRFSSNSLHPKLKCNPQFSSYPGMPVLSSTLQS